MKTPKQIFGKNAEIIAVNFLKEKGYEVLVCNYRYKKAEIDIIAKKDTLLLFVEVKARSTYQFGSPEDFVSLTQQKQIIMAAEEFIDKLKWVHNVRFDIISVLIDDYKHEIIHLEDAFY